MFADIVPSGREMCKRDAPNRLKQARLPIQPSRDREGVVYPSDTHHDLNQGAWHLNAKVHGT